LDSPGDSAFDDIGLGGGGLVSDRRLPFLIWDARQQCEDHGSSDGSISVDSTGVGRSGEDQNAEGPSAGGGC